MTKPNARPLDPKRCPTCGGTSKVVDTRQKLDCVWRRRKCLRNKAHPKWSTAEIIINAKLVASRVGEARTRGLDKLMGHFRQRAAEDVLKALATMKESA